MKPAARKGDKHNCPWHWTNSVATGSRQLITENERQARIGDFCWCTAPIFTGAATVIVDGRPAARLEDKTAHFGTLVTGARSVYMGGASTNAISFFISEAWDWLKENWKKVAEGVGLIIIGALAVVGIFYKGVALAIITAIALVIKLALGVIVDEKYLQDLWNPLSYLPFAKGWNAIKRTRFVGNIVRRFDKLIERVPDQRRIRNGINAVAERVADLIEKTENKALQYINHTYVLAALRRTNLLPTGRIGPRLLQVDRVSRKNFRNSLEVIQNIVTFRGGVRDAGEGVAIILGPSRPHTMTEQNE